MGGDGQDGRFPLAAHFEVCRVEPAHFEDFGRGMRCTEAVAKGEELLRVSLSNCWTAEAARRCPELSALGEERLECISDASLIALHILVVRAQGGRATDACRREHVALLESAEFDTMLDWPEEDLELLAGSKWAMVARACRDDIQEEFGYFDEELELGDFLRAHKIDASSFFWAHRLLISRSMQFFMEDGSMLYLLGPGQDMFNHSVDVQVGNDDVNLSVNEETGDRSLVIRAFKDYAVGEQAFYSYSGASNGRLLLMAGFTVPSNPYNAVELTFTFPVSPLTLPSYVALASGLDAGLRKPGSPVAEETKSEFMETLPYDAEVPSEVALHVRLSAGEALHGQLERTLAFFRLARLCLGGPAPSPEDLARSDADTAQRAQSLEQLRGHLRGMLAGYRSSREDDELALSEAEAALPAGADDGDAATRRARRRASCLRVLVGEKAIFAEALGYVEDRLRAQ